MVYGNRKIIQTHYGILTLNLNNFKSDTKCLHSQKSRCKIQTECKIET